MLVSFTKHLPKFSLDAEMKVVLIFDNTLHGLREASTWLKNNKQQHPCVHRVIVPFSENSNDVGDWLVAGLGSSLSTDKANGNNRTDGNNEPHLGEAHLYSKKRVFQIAKVDYQTSTDQTWPFPSQNRLVDFEYAYQHLLTQLLLRDVFTGLNVVQQYMADKIADKTTEEDEIKAMCCAKFKLPSQVVKDQFSALSCGNLPLTKFRDSPYPHALVNGPFPIKPLVIYNKLEGYFQNGRPIEFDSTEPFCDGYCFFNEDGKWKSKSMSVSGNVVSLPYGMPESKAPPKKNAWFEEVNYGKTEVKTTVEWDPRFIQGDFGINEFMQEWMRRYAEESVRRNLQLVEEQEKEEVKKKFLYSVWTVERERDENMGEFRVFFDEDQVEKRMRASEMCGDESVLETPIRLLDHDYIFSKPPMVEQCGQTLMLRKFNAFL